MNTTNIEPTEQGKTEELSPAASARRRALIRAGSRGAAVAVLAAAAPIKTLANQTLLTPDHLHQCSISGMQSGIHSATPANSPVCGGYSPGWWGQSDDGINPRRTWPALPNGWTHQTKCVVVFTQSTLRNDDGTLPSLFQIMEPKEPISKFANTDEFHWVCAWLNALSHSFNFPYTGGQVLDFYNAGKGTATYTNALIFFKTYMETHTS